MYPTRGAWRLLVGLGPTRQRHRATNLMASQPLWWKHRRTTLGRRAAVLGGLQSVTITDRLFCGE